MDVLSPLMHLALKSLVVLFPMTVVWLAFRRLAMSKSDNAWIYAATCLFAAVTAAGILPWALGIAPLNWVLLGLAVLCPVFWVATIAICDMSRAPRYRPDALADTAKTIVERTKVKLPPLLLSNPETAETAPVMFRHRKRGPEKEKRQKQRSEATNTIINLARDIRYNASSEGRRPKLLPPPADRRDMPFLKNRRSM